MTTPRVRAVDPGRLAKAVHLDVEPAAPGRWLVQGGARSHRVVELAGRLECDCADRAFRRVGCKHLLAVLLRRGHPHVLKALRSIVGRDVHTTDRSKTMSTQNAQIANRISAWMKSRKAADYSDFLEGLARMVPPPDGMDHEDVLDEVHEMFVQEIAREVGTDVATVHRVMMAVAARRN